MGKRRGGCIGSWWGARGKEKGDSGEDWRIILRWNFRKWDVGVWTGSSWLGLGTGSRHL